MVSLREQVGLAVRHQRKKRDWGQVELATKIDRSLEMISQIERGATAPSFETLTALSEAFEVPVGHLFWIADEVPDKPENDALARLVGRVATLDADDIEWVDRLVGVALARKVRLP